MSVHWSISRKLFSIVAALATLVVAASASAIWNASALNEQLDVAILKTAPKIDLALRIQQNAVAMRSEQRRILLGAYARDIAAVKESERQLEEVVTLNEGHLDKVAGLLETDDDRRLVAEIKDTASRWHDDNAEVIRLAEAGEEAEAWEHARSTGNPLLDRVDELTDRLLEEQNASLKQSEADGLATYGLAWSLSVAILLASLAIVVLVVAVVRGLVKTLQKSANELGEGAEQVASAAQQVSTAAQTLSQGTTEQAASLEQSSASMEEMASMARRNAENATRVAELAEETGREYHACHGALQEMQASMAAMSESSEKVSRIIKTIDEIAFQTNILALNAAVEAARAGEAGMGFAVVADEVRSLAHRSAQAAKDTSSLIEEAVANSHAGEERLRVLSGSIQRIGEATGQVRTLAGEVSTASAQQTQGVGQVTQAIQQMEKVTQTNAATAEESAAASEELAAQADASMAAVRDLRLVVDGERTPRAPIRAKKAGGRGPGRAAEVVRMPSRQAAVRDARRPEDEIPLEEGTGTYGRF